MTELADRLYPFRECNMCEFFQDRSCEKGKRPRKYNLSDGPNEECYAHFTCLEWQMFSDSERIGPRTGNFMLAATGF